MEEKEELILLKSEVKNIKSDIEEIKKDVKNHSEFSTQIALLTKTVNDLVDTVNKLINNVDKLNSKDSEKWINIVRKNSNKLNKSKLGWCNYLAMEEERKRNIKGGIAHGKPIEVFKEGVYLKTFPSAKELENQSLETFGTFLNSKNVSAVLNGRRKHHKGFTFSFV